MNARLNPLPCGQIERSLRELTALLQKEVPTVDGGDLSTHILGLCCKSLERHVSQTDLICGLMTLLGSYVVTASHEEIAAAAAKQGARSGVKSHG